MWSGSQFGGVLVSCLNGPYAGVAFSILLTRCVFCDGGVVFIVSRKIGHTKVWRTLLPSPPEVRTRGSKSNARVSVRRFATLCLRAGAKGVEENVLITAFRPTVGGGSTRGEKPSHVFQR